MTDRRGPSRRTRGRGGSRRSRRRRAATRACRPSAAARPRDRRSAGHGRRPARAPRESCRPVPGGSQGSPRTRSAALRTSLPASSRTAREVLPALAWGAPDMQRRGRGCGRSGTRPHRRMTRHPGARAPCGRGSAGSRPGASAPALRKAVISLPTRRCGRSPPPAAGCPVRRPPAGRAARPAARESSAGSRGRAGRGWRPRFRSRGRGFRRRSACAATLRRTAGFPRPPPSRAPRGTARAPPSRAGSR